MALLKKQPKVGAPPRVLTIEDIDLQGAIEDAFRALEATTLVIDKVLEALQEAREVTRLACRSDARAKHALLENRYQFLMGVINGALLELANGPIASGNAALAITIAQTGLVDDGLALDLPPSIGKSAAEARVTLASIDAAMHAVDGYAGRFRDTARYLIDHRTQSTTRH